MLKAIVPRPLKERIRAAHRSHTLQTSLRRTEQLLGGSTPASPELVEQLIYGWSNEGWSAKSHLVSYLLNETRHFSGTILECGTGLSTVLMAMIARRTGARLYSLEHNQEWHEIVSGRMAGQGLEHRGVLLTPLKTFGAFDWYDADAALADAGDFDLVLCDGPPNSTNGGRYGLMPRFFSRLRPGAQVIVDDAHRPEEAQMIQRWLAEHTGALQLTATFPTFAVLTVA